MLFGFVFSSSVLILEMHFDNVCLLYIYIFYFFLKIVIVVLGRSLIFVVLCSLRCWY